MKELSLADAFRFLMAGAVAFGYFYLCDDNLAIKVIRPLGEVGAVILMLAVGSVIYFVYIALIYHPIITRFQDGMRCKSDNYRTYLMERYSLTQNKTKLFWAELRDKHLSDRYENLKTLASGIHFLYIAGILAIPFEYWQYVSGDTWKTVVLGAIALLTLLVGFLLDRHCEDRELVFLKSLVAEKPETLYRTAKAFGAVAVENPNGSAKQKD